VDFRACWLRANLQVKLHAIDHVHCDEGTAMAKHSDERGFSKHLAAMRLLALLCLSVGATTLISDIVFAQQNYRASPRRAATTYTPPPATGAIATPPVIDKTSALGQALAACNQNEAAQETFALLGVKGEITLDRCYKGRAHLICAFTALTTEATSLTKTYTKIVDARYPDLTTVDGICKINSDTLASDIAGSEDFAKRFKELKSQYETATKCAANVEQAFREVSLADLTKAPEVLQSMTASLDGDVAKISKVQQQISDLSAQMEQSNKALKEVTKIHRAMCVKASAAETSGN
jgi:hypothetical protein